MSYETVVEQVRALPESCLEDVSKYVQFLLYQYGQYTQNVPVETDAVFQKKMEQGYQDMLEGRVTPLQTAVAEVQNRYC